VFLMVKAGSVKVVEEVEGECSHTSGCENDGVMIGKQAFRSFVACENYYKDLYEYLLDNIEPWEIKIQEDISGYFDDENLEYLTRSCPVCGDTVKEGSRYCSTHIDLEQHDDHVPRKD